MSRFLKIVRGFLVVAFLLIFLSFLVFRMCVIYVPLDKVGVRIQQYEIFGDKGVVKKDYLPGWHRDFGPVDQWVFYDKTIQILELSRETQPVIGKTLDGSDIEMDVTVTYRIREGCAYILYVNHGPGEAYKRVVQTEAIEVVRSTFRALEREKFLNPDNREQKSVEARESLSKKLASQGIQILDILLRDLRFDEKYENEIKQMKLSDQSKELKKVQKLAEEKRLAREMVEAEMQKRLAELEATLEGDKKKFQAETDREISKILAEAGAEATKVKAEADLYAAKQDAKGIEALKNAEAIGEDLRKKATEGAGGKVLVALEAAKNIQLKDVVLSTMSVDFLNIEKMVRHFGLDNANVPEKNMEPEKKEIKEPEKKEPPEKEEKKEVKEPEKKEPSEKEEKKGQ